MTNSPNKCPSNCGFDKARDYEVFLLCSDPWHTAPATSPAYLGLSGNLLVYGDSQAAAAPGGEPAPRPAWPKWKDIVDMGTHYEPRIYIRQTEVDAENADLRRQLRHTDAMWKRSEDGRIAAERHVAQLEEALRGILEDCEFEPPLIGSIKARAERVLEKR